MSHDRRERVIELRREGFTPVVIAERLGISRGTVCQWLREAGMGVGRPARLPIGAWGQGASRKSYTMSAHVQEVGERDTGVSLPEET